MNRRSLLAGALSAALLAAALPGLALAQDEEAVPYPVEGVQWQLQTLAGVDLPEGVEATLFMSGGSANGNAGCNSYFGSYSIDATSLTFPDPFGSTQKLCEEPAQSVEDQYLPALQATAGWTVDADGLLRLTDADGNESLVYGEPPVEITATDIEALAETLAGLQASIEQAERDVATVAEATAAIPVAQLEKRTKAVEKEVAKLDERTKGLDLERLGQRIAAIEAQVETLTKTVDRFRDRIKVLEDNDRKQNARINALEQANT